MNQFGIRLLCPTPRGFKELVREDAHSNGDCDAFHIEISELAPGLPIQTAAGHPRVRQPGDRDVVKNVVAREAFSLPVEHACD
jgi:hypothetical protein